MLAVRGWGRTYPKGWGSAPRRQVWLIEHLKGTGYLVSSVTSLTTSLKEFIGPDSRPNTCMFTF